MHVVNHAGKTLALVESSLPYEISNDLETFGAYDFGGKLVDSMTAHPKICPKTGELHFFGYGSIFAPHVTYHRADANGELTINRPLDVPALTMMHDFALTAEHVVFMLAGFALGLSISGVGEPRRLARQLFGITEGFFGPLFFVWLGAGLLIYFFYSRKNVERIR